MDLVNRSTVPKGTIMIHHPDLVIRFAHDLERSRIDAARQHRLARSIRAEQRALSAACESPPCRHGRVPWRQHVLAVRMTP